MNTIAIFILGVVIFSFTSVLIYDTYQNIKMMRRKNNE